MAFVGNTKHNVPYMLKHSHLFESIPDGYIKGAFLDRMHMYIPGWEVRILKSSVFSVEYGFIVDYLAELLRELRKSDYSPLLGWQGQARRVADHAGQNGGPQVVLRNGQRSSTHTGK